MGTRADFYVGRDPKTMDWKGSTAFDGYTDGFSDEAWTKATTEDEFMIGIRDMLSRRDDATVPDQGWPWPWDSSYLTDFVYAFDDGKVWASNGRYWWPYNEPEPYDEEEYERIGYKAWTEAHPYMEFPDMSKLKNVRMDKGSGLIVF